LQIPIANCQFLKTTCTRRSSIGNWQSTIGN
jgi:hypothetical protein